MDPIIVLLVAVICGLGTVVASTVGFGSALVAVPMLIAIDPALVPFVPLVAFAAGSLRLVVLLRTAVDWYRVGRQLIGYVPAAVATGWVTAGMSPVLRGWVALGLVVVALSALAVDVRLRVTGSRDVAGGALAGMAGVIAGTNGPPVLPLWWAQAHLVRRASLAAFFAAGDLVALAALRTRPDGWPVLTVFGVAGALVGVSAAGPLAGRLSEAAARTATIVLLVGALLAAVARLAGGSG